MPVNLLHNILNTERFHVQLHFLSVFCYITYQALPFQQYAETRYDHLLNLRFNTLFSLVSRGKSDALIFIVVRASAGKCAMNIRQVFPGLEKGLNLVVTSVMNLVIIVACFPVELYRGSEISSSYMEAVIPFERAKNLAHRHFIDNEAHSFYGNC